MLKNYFKVAWRNLRKTPFYSAVSILGLATGVTFTLLIAAYIWGELRVNKELNAADQQYIIQSEWKDPGMGYEMTTIGYLPRMLKEQFPNLVASYYRWDGIGSIVSKGDRHFREDIQIGDSTLLGMYGFTLLSGNAATALRGPYSVVITEDKANKYFNRADVVGQTLTIENWTGAKRDFVITGVLKKPFQNSVTNIDDDNNNEFFLSTAAAAFFERNIDVWDNPRKMGYLQLQPGVSPKELDGPMRQLIQLNAPPDIAANLKPYLVSLKSYYLNANGGAVRKTVLSLSFVAFFILLMAIVNVINISVSRASARMKEIGLRKVLGGLKKQLIWQFLIESVVYVLISTILALILYQLLRPSLSDVLGKPITSIFGFPLYFYLIPLLFAIVVGLLAGIYPAFFLSSMKSVDSVKGKFQTVKDKVRFRTTLVGFQFGTAATVFICAIIIYQQIDLFFSGALGYDKDYVVYVPLPRDWSQQGVRNMESIRYRLSQMPEVKDVALSFEIPNGRNGNNLQVYKQGDDSTRAISSQLLVADNRFASVYTIPLKAGSFFMPDYIPGDSAKIVINESQVKALGWADPEKAIGQHLRFQGDPVLYTVCGVTRNFQFGSMVNGIMPVTFVNVNYNLTYRFFSIKFKPGNIEKGITAMQNKWSSLFPAAPFEYHFMDDALKQMYQTEIQLKKASYTATILTFIIVLLGVIGLVALSIQRRIKEIGIRKVLGASTWGIIAIFLKEFLLIVLAACLIACPIAYLLMHRWLDDYASRVAITPVPFIYCIVVLAAITGLLIIFQTVRSALASPMKSLKMEG